MSSSLASAILGSMFAQVTAGVGPTFGAQRGFSTVTRNGAGDYTLLTQDGNGLNLTNEANAQCTAQGALAAICSVEAVDTTHYRVRTFDAAGAAIETNFWLSIQNLGPA